MPDPVEPVAVSSPILLACRAMDYLWRAGNLLSHIDGAEADRLCKEVDDIHNRVAENVLRRFMKTGD